MTPRTFFIETHGCQMNLYDSQVISEMLAAEGHRPAGRPEDADIVLINTCSVRDRAERKALSRIAEVAALRRRKPDLIIGVTGCMAQRLGERLIGKDGEVDLVLGPDTYARLPALLERLARPGEGRDRAAVVDIAQDRGCLYSLRPRNQGAVTAFVTIMRGCDNYCSYCIVPYVRGRERSKPRNEVLAEIAHLVDLGVREVTLLGQNVNSYRDRDCDFAGLLAVVNEVPGLERIRFTTSHPKDLTPHVIACIRDLPRVCESLHLPLQSGSDRILKRMNRGYSCRDYLELVETARREVPGITISTDLMVGFPAETEADHRATLDTMRACAFDSAFMFRYSPREGTRAAQWDDDVSEAEKTRRLKQVIELENEIVDAAKAALWGTEVEVLIEGPSRREKDFMIGRTRKNWLAKLPQKGVRRGEIVVAKVASVTRWMVICDTTARKVGS